MTARAWRSLVRVVGVTAETMEVVVPGWDTQRVVTIPLVQLPEELLPLIEPNRRLHARVNIGAESAADLVFSDWEPS